MIDAKSIADMSDQLPKFFKALNNIPQTILNFASAGAGTAPNKPAGTTTQNALADAADTLKEASESLAKVTAKLDTWIGRPLSRENADDGSLAAGNIDRVLADLPNLVTSFVTASKSFEESTGKHKDASEVFARAAKDWADVSQRVGDINKQTTDTFRDAVNTFANIVNQAAQTRGDVTPSRYRGDDGQQEQGIVPARQSHDQDNEPNWPRGVARYPGARQFVHARKNWNKAKALPGPKRVNVQLLSAGVNKAPTLAGAAMSAAGTTASALAGLANPVTLAIGAVVAFAAVMYKGATAAEANARSLLQAQDELRKYNASIASSLVRLEVGDIIRKFDSGRRTQESVGYLANSTDALSDVLQPFKDLGTNIGNTISGVINQAFTSVMSPFVPVANELNILMKDLAKSLNRNKDDERESIPLRMDLERVAREEQRRRGFLLGDDINYDEELPRGMIPANPGAPIDQMQMGW